MLPPPLLSHPSLVPSPLCAWIFTESAKQLLQEMQTFFPRLSS